MIARRAAFSSNNILSGFRNTGLFPIDRNLVISKIEATRSRYPNPKSSSPNPNPSQSPPILSDPQPLSTLSVPQINSLKIPLNKAEIERQELIVLESLRGNDLKEWGLKKVISNMAISANRALTELDKKERQIENLRKQLVE